MENEFERLLGGNSTSVYKQNETVFREQKAWSSTIHSVLRHLEKVGYTNGPRFIGIDNSGMEVLSFVPGECKDNYPFTNDKNEQLSIIKKVAVMIRRFHDATLSFKGTDEDKWMFSYNGPLEKEVICHNDIAPYNITFVDDIPYGMIDFDTCCPAPRIWDIVYALYRFVPFSEKVYDAEKQKYRSYDVDIDKEFRKNSIGAFFDAYGMKCPYDLFEQMIARLQSLADLIYSEAKNGNSVFRTMMEDGHRDLYLTEIDFIREHAKEWL
ncbi:trifolitoxin immunity domain-containing protein [Clostridium zeae]|uniref:Trifolitoxin immunity domain-containing protein n=1 Tax=Clostridium zeae TaxID=2759022 RepID=A0ABQ1EED6_9CLOT|nr:aminoglycoside phosphotransferase family protein [Clostridium zeae]GFZ33152.1 trifolitoxin immunity domain-containing protein [Clostridium zeae]